MLAREPDYVQASFLEGSGSDRLASTLNITVARCAGGASACQARRRAKAQALSALLAKYMAQEVAT